jgi:hypothetical protein
MTTSRRIVLTAALALLAFVPLPALAQGGECARQATVRATTDVYDRPPTFYTGEGWKLGQVVGRLERGRTVLVCEEKDVGFFGIQRKGWVRIQAPAGWIFREKLSANAAAPRFSLVPPAYAEDTDRADGGTGLPELDAGPFYAVIFGGLLFGMLAKAFFDELEEPAFSTQRTMRRSVKALLVSPIVAIGILQAGNYGFTSTFSFWVSLFIAFQNGFFWQTLLRPPK